MNDHEQLGSATIQERRRIQEYDELNECMITVDETWERPSDVEDAAMGEYEKYDVVSEYDPQFDEDGIGEVIQRRLRFRVPLSWRPANVQYQGPDWLVVRWEQLTENARTVIAGRAVGRTFESVGTEIGVTRERARQIQQNTEATLSIAARLNGVAAHLDETFGDAPAVAASTITAALPTAEPQVHKALLFALGFRHPRCWDGDLTDWWTKQKGELDRMLNTIADLAPLSDDDLQAALSDLGLPYAPPITDVLNSAKSRLRRTELGWHRPGRAGRDLAFLFLQREGAPRAVGEIAVAAGVNEHAIRETMRREAAFAQVRPEGTWALADWRVPGSDNRYSSAEEAVVEVIRELGPITLGELRNEVIQRYPVSTWRVNQCLSLAMIGLTSDGRYDLAERGAKPIEDTEPRRPATIEAKGHIVGVQLTVNFDLLRGSGIPVNRWLTWYLGLRIVPSTRSFDLETGGEVTIKRNSSNSQLSSLRAAIQALDLVEGCKIALILNTDTKTARIRHVCGADTCPVLAS